MDEYLLVFIMSFLNHEELPIMSYINKKYNLIYNKYFDQIWNGLIHNINSIEIINCNTHYTIRKNNYGFSFPYSMDYKRNFIAFVKRIKYHNLPLYEYKKLTI